ncbi:MAG: hypothetical protein U5N86_03530 [Planctomycetota bacterium]|nr:hypothetical protein [Planctomycetota bacterium]
MLAKEAEVPTGHFAIARLYVPCCVAMAQALYIPVEGESRAEFSGGQWLAVFGTLRRDGENVYIEPEEIVPTAQPSNPYVFG